VRYLRFTLSILSCLTAACVSYEHVPVEIRKLAEEVDAREVEPLDFAAAVDYARRHNPGLRGLAAEARAAGLDVPSTTLLATTNTLQEHSRLVLDLLDVLKLGPRGAAIDAAKQRQLAMLARLVEAERSNAADIAEAFLVERTLRELKVPEVPRGLTLFHGAGLASEADNRRIDQARLARDAELEMLVAWRQANVAWLKSLLGLGSRAQLELTLPDGEFPAMPEGSRERLLGRPDLAVMLAEYYTADARFKQAVREQYPSLLIGGELTYSGGGGAIVGFKIPVGASKRARAEGERREAARLAVEDALLSAEREGVALGAEYVSAAANARAHVAHLDASLQDYAASRQRLDVEPDAFRLTARRAVEAMRAATERREAVVAAARARVRFAEAYGWPRTGELR